jgi:hypothetical protein
MEAGYFLAVALEGNLVARLRDRLHTRDGLRFPAVRGEGEQEECGEETHVGM